MGVGGGMRGGGGRGEEEEGGGAHLQTPTGTRRGHAGAAISPFAVWRRAVTPSTGGWSR
jgi:hypothetical protein